MSIIINETSAIVLVDGALLRNANLILRCFVGLTSITAKIWLTFFLIVAVDIFLLTTVQGKGEMFCRKLSVETEEEKHIFTKENALNPSGKIYRLGQLFKTAFAHTNIYNYTYT